MLSSSTVQNCVIWVSGTSPAFISGCPAQLVVHMHAHATLVLDWLKPSKIPDSNTPHSNLASVIITETHLHLYFPSYVSNQMHRGKDWSDMNLITDWWHIRNTIKLSSSPNRPSTERKQLVMAWRTLVYVVSTAGILNGLSSQKLGFILESTNKNPFYLNTLLALNGIFLNFFPSNKPTLC